MLASVNQTQEKLKINLQPLALVSVILLVVLTIGKVVEEFLLTEATKK